MGTLGYGAESVPVAVEEIAPAEWAEKTYKADILAKPGALYKRPGYEM